MKTTPKRKRALTLGFQSDRALLERVDRQAQQYNVSRSDVLRWAVLEWLKTNEEAR